MRGVADLATWHWEVCFGADGRGGVALDLQRAARSMLHTLQTLPDPGLSMEGLLEHQFTREGGSLWAAMCTVPATTYYNPLASCARQCADSNVPWMEL